MNIWWVRRDLRLSDNQALTAALSEGGGVVPVFILDEHLLNTPAEKRQAFLFAGLRELDHDLRSRGSRLVIRRGDPATELARIAAECSAADVYAEQDVTPYAIRRDLAVGRKVNLHLVGGLGVHPPASVVKSDGNPYTVFTPYSRAWRALPFSSQTLPTPAVLPPVPAFFSAVPPDLPVPDLFSLVNAKPSADWRFFYLVRSMNIKMRGTGPTWMAHQPCHPIFALACSQLARRY